MRRQQVLVVENEQIVALDLEACLETMGYAVAFATTGEDATLAVEKLKPDLVLMDIRLDGSLDGIQAAEQIRRDSDTPLVFLTAYTDHQTIERAAKVDPAGYIVKPFDERELAATLHLALHRQRRDSRFPAGNSGRHPQQGSTVTRIGKLTIDHIQCRVYLREAEIQLTKKEFDILCYLVEHAGEPVSPGSILLSVWGPQFAHYVQTLRVHIGNLRQKIETGPSSGVVIEAIRGMGYRLVEIPHPALVSRS